MLQTQTKLFWAGKYYLCLLFHEGWVKLQATILIDQTPTKVNIFIIRTIVDPEDTYPDF